MFGLARASTVKQKNERIDELEEKVSDLSDLKSVRENYNDLEQSFELLEEQFDTLPEVYDEVIKLDEPRIAYKATQSSIATLLLPEGTTVVFPSKKAQMGENFEHDKLRCSEVKVIRLQDITVLEKNTFLANKVEINSGEEKYSSVGSYDNSIVYERGKKARAEDGALAEPLDESTRKVCSDGIHIFREKSHAIEWGQ